MFKHLRKLCSANMIHQLFLDHYWIPFKKVSYNSLAKYLYYLCFFILIYEYTLDEVVKRKDAEPQFVKDENGRRRFHGAFTGGFSAGFYNTVGSLEGWTPSNFKSSRDSKASLRSQNAFDFMDDEVRHMNNILEELFINYIHFFCRTKKIWVLIHQV